MPSRRAAITAFTAFHPLQHGNNPGWREYSGASQPLLRELFGLHEGGQSRNDADPAQGAWWERFFSCGIIGEPVCYDSLRVGVCLSSSKGRPALLEKTGEYSLGAAPDWAVHEVLQRSRARGKTGCPVAACAGGAHAVALAAQWIEDGYCDAVLCGAIEAELAPLVLAGYASLGALCRSGRMRPFHTERDGFVPTSGGAMLLLENEELARARGAHIHGTIAGWSMNCDATSLTGMEPSGESIAHAMGVALSRAGRGGVDYVNAHGTATRQNDVIEARAIARVLGAETPVSSTKALTGHMMGATGAVEVVFCLMAMEQGYAPPNLHLDDVDEGCAGIDLVREGRELKIESAMSLSYGFGGHIGVIVMEKAEQ